MVCLVASLFASVACFLHALWLLHYAMQEFTRQRALGLYRSILRLHRDRLPPVMRDLGDKYVRYVRTVSSW
jgi:hypothetical protein